MKFLFLLSMLISFGSFAHTEAHCRLTNGIYKNSNSFISMFKFETIVDVFTLNNANTLTMTIDGEELKFIRSELSSGRRTKMMFLYKKKSQIQKVAQVMIDRTPRKVAYDREFYGNIVITSMGFNQVLTYNFHCQF